MKKRKVSKKGISPLVSTILLIGFVIAIILLIVLWGKNYIEELAQKKGALAEKQHECTKIQLGVVKSCWRGTTAEVAIKNKADLPVHKFVFRAVGAMGEPVEKMERLGSLETQLYELEFSSDVGKVNNIDIIPHLKVALGHYVPCSKQKITARLIGDC
ncbi:MAG: hypothetical protein ISS23_03445 [Nanoarchaeota archaeon]|nr:hypothetical protein [Nanoarchaeota archaeon]